MALTLNPLTEADISACCALDTRVSDYPWAESTFRRGLQSNHWARVALSDEQLVGFCICLLVADELSILNIAVDQAWQRQGVGQTLLSAALEAGRTHGATEAFLEVRQSNAGAQALYASNGFHIAGIREDYYPARKPMPAAPDSARPRPGREHALIMARTLLA
ncbi:ribosomal-protein-alanine N-acetyltransferase [Natronospirillum operosum]|uniref:Ribosomal-protein-alanine N-acetyltransferase n=1 Tax=Natronospirillum operosum TaxID=2759953 RepID=A0A4Z0WEH8_9GAMM|nr:ribosomal protein S18-alanine N-acetyltransferase [Natronospirillum operosum]TGG92708.1 ribosomal-protein-alanine N-acetyltransferase [Natronospirillum operosum]